MAQNTRQWADLVRLTQARAGAAFAAGTELDNISFLLNSAAHIMYSETPWWERYLVVEPRTVERGYVAFTEDSYNVFGAGTTDANGLYVRDGNSVDGNPRYSLYAEDGTKTHDIESTGNVAWAIQDLVTAEILYSIGSSSTTPPESGWTVETDGESPAPLVQALSEIGEYIGHWNGQVFACSGSTPGTAYPDHNGIRITNCNQGDTAWVAYKKAFTDVYGDGENGTTSEVPSEWFEFMAYHAARSYQESQGEQIQSIALSTVQTVKDQALLKINRQGIYNNIASRFRTWYGCDVSVR